MEMEDAHVVESLDHATIMFGVFDGHGGKEVALYLAKHLPSRVIQTAEYQAGQPGPALRTAFLKVDAELLTDAAVAELKVLGEGGEDCNAIDDLSCPPPSMFLTLLAVASSGSLLRLTMFGMTPLTSMAKLLTLFASSVSILRKPILGM